MVKLPIALFAFVVIIVVVNGQSGPICNFVTNRFKTRDCVTNKRFPCGLFDRKMNFLNCREFACENYRDLPTFCTGSCEELEIANGLCANQQTCCLRFEDSSSLDPNNIKQMGNSGTYEINAST